jgi:hypothetical protein
MTTDTMTTMMLASTLRFSFNYHVFLTAPPKKYDEVMTM